MRPQSFRVVINAKNRFAGSRKRLQCTFSQSISQLHLFSHLGLITDLAWQVCDSESKCHSQHRAPGDPWASIMMTSNHSQRKHGDSHKITLPKKL